MHLLYVTELQSALREITRGSIMCQYLTTNDLVYEIICTIF